ncbi:MAG TPA: zinc ribbon domain-containing protein, partial [Herpetosiphonaceae bacterium]
MQCPICGHNNDAGNRFCEYCGSRLEAGAVQEATMAVTGSNKVACPSCGASVTPGETFCEVCGAALPHSSSAGADTYEAPTMFVPSDAAPQGSPAAAGGAPICGVCGYTNQPGDRFCDQCGASLQSAAPAVGADDRTVIGAPPVAAPEPAAPQPIGADDR